MPVRYRLINTPGLLPFNSKISATIPKASAGFSVGWHFARNYQGTCSQYLKSEATQGMIWSDVTKDVQIALFFFSFSLQPRHHFLLDSE
jgi:hypothetical protein